jgi:hypothetical protein
LASLGPFIVNSSPLAMVMVGWVYLLSSSFSFPELLVGFPRPTLLTCSISQASAWKIRSQKFAGEFVFPLPFGSVQVSAKSNPPGRREVIG